MKKFILLFLVAFVSFGFAQEKKPLTFADYAKWNRITRAGISPDGNWVAYGQQPNGGDDTLFIRNI
ncbi:MAG TPA: hypothetical protein VKZ78_02675, partial [Sphingobacteriaceae bacterium]|nr:hypothetical protein [Sphingobacteriaceae bacterium]